MRIQIPLNAGGAPLSTTVHVLRPYCKVIKLFIASSVKTGIQTIAIRGSFKVKTNASAAVLYPYT